MTVGQIIPPRETTLGMRLAILRLRAGLSLSDVAHRGGWAGPSSVQRYLEGDFDPDPKTLRLDFLNGFAEAFVGRGDPAITMDEVMEAMGFDKVLAPYIQRSKTMFDRKTIETCLAALPNLVEQTGTLPDYIQGKVDGIDECRSRLNGLLAKAEEPRRHALKDGAEREASRRRVERQRTIAECMAALAALAAQDGLAS